MPEVEHDGGSGEPLRTPHIQIVETKNHPMKTRIPIDTALLQQALAAAGSATTRDVVEAALRAFVRSAHVVPAERGWQPPLPALREEFAA